MTANDERAAALPIRESTDSTGRPRISRVKSTTSTRSANVWQDGKKAQHSKWRHTVGILLLLVTVVLWTASNFLASVSISLRIVIAVRKATKTLIRYTGHLRRRHLLETLLRDLHQHRILYHPPGSYPRLEAPLRTLTIQHRRSPLVCFWTPQD